ncbi:MAG: hypothetical protein DA408_14495 [Bacteroidetes bacterium]|nr:MAG: hypothetical protein DA408_14495 [Bacteroidota bacterium]
MRAVGLHPGRHRWLWLVVGFSWPVVGGWWRIKGARRLVVASWLASPARRWPSSCPPGGILSFALVAVVVPAASWLRSLAPCFGRSPGDLPPIELSRAEVLRSGHTRPPVAAVVVPVPSGQRMR